MSPYELYKMCANPKLNKALGDKKRLKKRFDKKRYPNQIGIILERKYGMTKEDYDRMSLDQGGVCAICRCHCTSGRRLAVDHNHSTGFIRGLLCSKCNLGIGAFKDSPKLLISAIEYLLGDNGISLFKE